MEAPESAELAKRLGIEMRGEVLTSQFDLGRYATDASCYQIMPLCVAVPRDIPDVRAAIGVCRELGVPVLPRGGGTSQCGQTVNRALVLDLSKYLNRILPADDDESLSGNSTLPGNGPSQDLTIDPDQLRLIKDRQQIRVQPGIVLDHLNAALKPAGLWFPVDVSTASRATIGGMTANNSCGSRSIRYGTMRHNVEAVQGLLADGTRGSFGTFRPGSDAYSHSPGISKLVTDLVEFGQNEQQEIRKRFPDLLRRVGGYNIDALINTNGQVNLGHLLVGSEGTLAFSESIDLKLQPLPVNKTLGVCHFPRFHDAMESTRHIVKLDPVAVELVDRNMIELSRDIPLFKPVIEGCVRGEPDALLLVEFAETDQSENLRRLKNLSELISELGFHWDSAEASRGGVVEVVDSDFQKSIWEVRKQGLNIMMSMKSEGKPVSFVEDCAVRLEDLAEYTKRLTDIFTRFGTQGTWYAHASVGTLHVRPVLNLKLDQDLHNMRAIAEETFEMVKQYKGSHSGEHGDGIVRSEFHGKMFGQRMIRNFEWVKDRFDPSGLFNPNKIVRAPKMDDRSLLRYPEKYSVPSIHPQLDWSQWPGTGGGFQGAVEMCNNNGACRKLGDGVMCPSYRVTRNERDLVRGRANSLRLALSGQLGDDAFSSNEMMETMKLCVSCKACRRECPTGVDMASMKIEVLGARALKHGISIHEKLVAYLPHYAPFVSRVPWFGNLRNNLPLFPWLLEKLADFSADRDLPLWRRDYFRDNEIVCKDSRPDVVLLADTFNRYFEPENLRAAVQVLGAAGYSVGIASTGKTRPLCCGRTFLSAGLIGKAKAEARRTIEVLLPYARDNAVIIGLEPSCLLTLRDEIPKLLPGEDSKLVAQQSRMFEEFIADETDAGRFAAKFKPIADKAMLHGHCHQKAFNAMDAVNRTLSLVPELEVENIQSSCCGMAGSFGYHRDTIEVSKSMAELSLLPKVRSAAEDTLIIADGTSCRQQIRDGSGNQSIHVARVLQRALLEH
jgi:FAD/FMN-containing dehydrogenase/Fe-S oxidoreductase